jgi:hypothetical protein
MTRAGRGIRGAAVTLTDGNAGSYRSITNTFGYFRFADIPAGTGVVLSASARGYTFSSRFVELSSDISDITIIAEP